MRSYKFVCGILLISTITSHDILANDSISSSARIEARMDSIRQTKGFAPRMAIPDMSTPIQVMSQTAPESYENLFNYAVGEIPIQSGVSPTGARTYTVPIEAYPGIGEMTPQISLSYSSVSGNGIAGIGWNIAGLSSIIRTNKSLHYDGKTEGISQNANDAFMLDGQRLIRIADEDGIPCYQTAQGNIKVKATLSGEDVANFTVLYPNGTIGTYSSSDEGKSVYPITSLKNIDDVSINYTYTCEQNYHLIQSIAYSTNKAKIDFTYEERPDSITSFSNGYPVIQKKRLNKITCTLNSVVLREYPLTYTTINSASHLSSIGYTANDQSLNPLTFVHGEGDGENSYTTETNNISPGYTSNINSNKYLRLIKGKFYYYQSEGLLILPNKSSYLLNSNSTSSCQVENEYNGISDNHIYVAYDLKLPYSPAFGITIGNGFADVFCADIEGTQQEYIIKADNTISAGKDLLKFSLFTHSGTSNIALLDTVTFDLGNAFTNSKGVKSVRPKNFNVGDFNGDGRQDVMVIICPVHGEDNAVISNCIIYDLANYQVLYQGKPFDYYPQHPIKDKDNTERLSCSERVFVYDYNGDGKSDIALINANGISVYEFQTTGTGIISCQQINHTTNITKDTSKNRELLFGEFNGDGLMDLILTPLKKNNDNIWSIFYSKGDGSFLSKTFIGPIPGSDSANDGFIVQDVNNDGKTDLIQFTKNSFSTFLTQEDHPGSVSSHTQTIEQYSTIAPTNITSHNHFSQILTLNKNILTKYSFQNDTRKQRLLTSMTNSLYNTEHTTYKYPHDEGSSYRTQLNGQITFPYVILKEGIPFITSSHETCCGDTLNEQWYEFTNLVLHRQGLGFCGMTSTKLGVDGFITSKSYDPTRYGILIEENTQNINYNYGTPINRNTYTYEIIHPNTDNDAFVQVNLIKKVTNDYLNDFTTTSDYSYNEYGFPYFELTSTSDGYVIEVIQEVVHHTDSKYMLNVVNEKIVETYHNGVTHNVKTTYPEMYYNKPKKKYQYINGNQVSYETFTYRSDGLLSKETIQHYNSSETLSTLHLYDIHGRSTREIQSGRKSVSYTYNSNGQLATFKDRLGNTTSYTYDAFGRKIRTDYADGTWENMQYSWQNGSPVYEGTHVNPFGYCIITTHSNGHWERSFYNARKQNIENHSCSMGSSYFASYRTYDKKGNLLTQTLPAIYYQTNMGTAGVEHTYDLLNRLIKTESPYRNITYTYNKNQVTTVEDGITTTRTYDSQGNMTAVTDATGTTTYTYRPDGQMLSATVPSGLTTTVEYDEYGRRTKLIDPCAGTTTFTYHSSSGLLASKTDATGKQTRTAYDKFGRLTRKEHVGLLTTRYTYNDLEQLTDETDSNGATRNFGYDQYGRLAWDYQGIDTLGTHNLTRTYNYDGCGNLASVTYGQENGSNAILFGTEHFEYINGQLKKTTFESASLESGEHVIWDIEFIDGYGMTERAASGMLKHHYMYDEMQQPVYIASEEYGEETLREEEYAYDDATGNMVSRRDLIRRIDEYFSYDHMNRLIGDSIATFDDQYKTTEFGYDNTTGNMTYNSRLGYISYGQIQPGYRLTAIDPMGIGSASSNYMSTLQQTATYNAMSRPASITEDKHTLEFTYNGRGERIKSRFYKKDNSNPVLGTVTTELEQRYYLDNVYERHIKENGDERVILYLGGDAYSAPVAFVMDEQYGPHLAYICRDHLGSIVHVFSDQYNKEYSYDAWGNLRDPESYDLMIPDRTQNVLYLGRGYTGHEHHGHFGLINMNARLYEPIVGRFISPDPFVQMPDNSQNFNRYTYCLNNPLRYVDPSGEIVWFIPVIVGAVVGAYAGASLQSGTAEFWNWDSDAWQGAIAGALIGASIGGFVSSGIGATGVAATTSGGGVSNAFGTATTIFNSASVNIGINSAFGGGWDGAWKAGLSGAVTGAWTATGGFNLVKAFGSQNTLAQIGGKLGYQMIGTTLGSIGNNWSMGNDPFSRITLGVGPINLTLGKGEKLFQWEDNIANILTHGVGLTNSFFGGKVNWDWSNLSATYSGGFIDYFMGNKYSGYGAHAIFLDKNPSKKTYLHELHHLWQSRSMNNRYLLNYGQQCLNALFAKEDPLFDYNFFEKQAYGHHWWE